MYLRQTYKLGSGQILNVPMPQNNNGLYYRVLYTQHLTRYDMHEIGHGPERKEEFNYGSLHYNHASEAPRIPAVQF